MRWCWLLLSGVIWAQTEQVPIDLENWHVQAQECHLVNYLGLTAIRLQGGAAQPKIDAFQDGVIEFDIAFGPARSFSGIAFRAVDARNYEHFYLRPHQTGEVDANQYTPSFHGVAGWQLYHGPQYGGAFDYRFDAWMHVKIEVSGRRAAFYIDDMDNPLFVNEALKREIVSGDIAITASSLAPAYFTNLSVERRQASAVEPLTVSVPAGHVARWSVSSIFAGDQLGPISLQEPAGLQWQTLMSEASGVVNLAQVGRPDGDNNTVLAKVAVKSLSKTTKVVRFGYSDSVRVYLNGDLLYSGDNGYRSRDYRHLGTIGLFDAVPLNLKKGDNQLVFAVTEQFGGWGVMCQFPDKEGLVF